METYFLSELPNDRKDHDTGECCTTSVEKDKMFLSFLNRNLESGLFGLGADFFDHLPGHRNQALLISFADHAYESFVKI